MITRQQALLRAYIFAERQSARASDDERARLKTSDEIVAEQSADTFLQSYVELSDDEHNARVLFALARLTLIVTTDARVNMRNFDDACTSLLALCDSDDTLRESIDELRDCVEHNENKTHIAHALVCVTRDALDVWEIDADELATRANAEHARDESTT